MNYMNIRMMIIFAISCVAACSSNKSLPPELLEQNRQVMADEYRIGVDDQIQITVWGNEALTVSMPVRPDGKVSMPLIGDVQAGGLTAEEMSEQIRVRLADFVRNPNVTVQITELRSHEYLSRVRITGAVQTQISIPYRQGMTILDAVLAAGGVTAFAAPSRSILQRTTANGSNVYEIDLDRILNKGDIGHNVALAPGDTITVPQRAF